MDRIDGTAEVGSRLTVHLAGRGGRGTTFRPTVLVATPGEELRWIGRPGPRGPFDGVHSFVLTTNPDGTTRLTHGERFTGILVALFQGATANSHGGFVAFNEGSQAPRRDHRLQGPPRRPGTPRRRWRLIGWVAPRRAPPARTPGTGSCTRATGPGTPVVPVAPIAQSLLGSSSSGSPRTPARSLSTWTGHRPDCGTDGRPARGWSE